MKVDEERKYALTKFSTKNGVKSLKVSDHNLLILELSIKWNSLNNMNERQEMFNFQDVENFQKFEMLTESDDELGTCFDDCDDLNKAANKWMKRFNFLIQKSFRKIRIRKQKVNPELETLFKEKESLRTKISEIEDDNLENIDEILNLDEEYDEVVDKISDICASRNKELVDKYLGKTKDAFEGYNPIKTWALKKKLAPKSSMDPPAAKRDENDKLVTDKKDLEKLYLKTYIDRLTPNPIREDLEDLFELKSMLFDMRIEESKSKVTEDWTMDELEKVLKSLENRKARDAHGHIYELFKFGRTRFEDISFKIVLSFQEEANLP